MKRDAVNAGPRTQHPKPLACADLRGEDARAEPGQALQQVDGFGAELAALRRANATRSMPVDIVERVFTLGLALEQLRRNLSDLARCVAELSAAGPAAGPIAAEWRRPPQ